MFGHPAPGFNKKSILLISKHFKMKKRNTILLLGISAIAIVIIAQIIIIRGILKQNYEMLDLRYRLLSQEAVSTLRRQRAVDVYDTVRFILDRYSEKAAADLLSISDQKELEEKKKEILDYFTMTLNQEQDLSGYLSAYFERMGVDKNFTHRIEIRNLEIISRDTFPIVRDENFFRMRPPERGRPAGPGLPQTAVPAVETGTTTLSGGISTPGSSRILVERRGLEDNFYFLFFEYYID
mgnify:CR=1 FL=1